MPHITLSVYLAVAAVVGIFNYVALLCWPLQLVLAPQFWFPTVAWILIWSIAHHIVGAIWLFVGCHRDPDVRRSRWLWVILFAANGFLFIIGSILYYQCHTSGSYAVHHAFALISLFLSYFAVGYPLILVISEVLRNIEAVERV